MLRQILGQFLFDAGPGTGHGAGDGLLDLDREMGRDLARGKEMGLEFRPDLIQPGNDGPAAFMNTDLHQSFFAFIAQGHIAAGEDHVGGSRFRTGGYAHLPVGEAQVLSQEFLEAGLFQIRDFDLAVDHRHLSGGEGNEPVQVGTAVEQRCVVGPQRHFFGQLEGAGEVRGKEGQQAVRVASR